MTDKNALIQFRKRLLQEIEKYERLAKNENNTPLEAHQKLLDGIKDEINKNLVKLNSLQKAEMNKSTFGLSSGTPSEAEVEHQNNIPVKSVFDILKEGGNLQKGMGVFHALRTGTMGNNQANAAREQARGQATSMVSPAPRTKSIPSKLKMSHGDYGISKNVDGTLSLIYNKKYKSPILHFLFGNKPKELGRFGHRAEAYQALLGHHDQVNAGLIKGEEHETDDVSTDVQSKTKQYAILPEKDKGGKDQDDPKTTGSGGQVKSTKKLMKDDGTGILPTPKATLPGKGQAPAPSGVTKTHIPSPGAVPSGIKPIPLTQPTKLPAITPQPAKPMNPNFMGGQQKTLLSNTNKIGNNAAADRMNIMSGIAQFSKNAGVIEGGGAVTGDNPMDKDEKLDKAFIGGKDPKSREITNHAMSEASKAAKVNSAKPAAQQSLKMPSQEIHAQRHSVFSDFMPKGKFSKNELMKEMESMDKWQPSMEKSDLEKGMISDMAAKAGKTVRNNALVATALAAPLVGAVAGNSIKQDRQQQHVARVVPVKDHNAVKKNEEHDCAVMKCGPNCGY